MMGRVRKVKGERRGGNTGGDCCIDDLVLWQCMRKMYIMMKGDSGVVRAAGILKKRSYSDDVENETNIKEL